MKELIKKILKGSAFGRVIYEPLHRCYRLYSVPHRRRLLQRNGKAVLVRLSGIFKKYNIPAFAAYGTLLGFIRENGFLKHDDDIDIGILPGEWTPQRLLRVLLEEESGFSYLFGFLYNDKVTEFKLQYNNVPIDFFFYEDDGKNFFAGSYHYFPEVKYPTPNANSAQRVCEPRITSLTSIYIYGFAFPIPANPELVLEKLYGNWRMPDENWNDDKHPGIENLPGFAYCITKEEALSAKR